MEKSKSLFSKQWFIKSNTTDIKIENVYKFDVDKAVGSGSFGVVVKAERISDPSEKRAIKIIKKNKLILTDDLQNEIQIMKELDHPNIIKLYEIYEDIRFLYLVMEFCEGGELFDRIIERKCFSENDAKLIFLQMMQSINYLHNKKLCHRDLKPENFLLINKTKDSPIKTIDFGLSRHFNYENKKVNMHTNVGTSYYIAPEVLLGSYDERCDVWSAGVILYILLTGVPPFNGKNDAIILENIRKMKYSLEIPQMKNVSHSAKNLILDILVKQQIRPTAAEVLKHPWIKDTQDITIEYPISEGSLDVDWQTFSSFQKQSKLKKATLLYIASQLSESEIYDIGRLFKKYDSNNDGVISFDEFKKIFNETEKKEIQSLFESIDIDDSKSIDYNEFLASTLEKKYSLQEQKLHSIFCQFDSDGSGSISAEELKKILGGQEFSQDKDFWSNLIKEADKNNDGEIDRQEFLDMMTKESWT